MTETVQFRIQLPVSLRDRFKTYCLKSNVTMTDKLEAMIEREVSGMSPTQLAATSHITSLNDDRLIAKVIDAANRLGASAAAMSDGLQHSLGSLETKLLRAIPKPPGASEIAGRQRETAEADQKRLQQMLGKVDRLKSDVVTAVELGQREMLAAIASKYRLRHALGAGTLLGMAASACLLWAISGTSPARLLAIRLSDQHGAWNAALWIAGNRQPKRTALLSETAGLLQTQEFQESYGRCVERAKRSKRNINCTVTFTMLDEVQ